METSPLSLFEAVFKVVEERMPCGRLIVTITSGLMMASLIVFCVGYLAGTLAAMLNWIILSLKTRSLAPLTVVVRFDHYTIGQWWLAFGILAGCLLVVWWAWIINIRTIKTLKEYIALNKSQD